MDDSYNWEAHVCGMEEYAQIIDIHQGAEQTSDGDYSQPEEGQIVPLGSLTKAYARHDKYRNHHGS